MSKATDLRNKIVGDIIAQIETGDLPWRAPWISQHGMPKRSTGQNYKGINIVLLWAAAMEKGFYSSQWFTFKQAKDLGANVRKGEKSTPVFYYGTFTKEDEKTGEDKTLRFLKSYRVFNACQIDNLPEKYAPTLIDRNREPDPRAREMLAYLYGTSAKIETLDAARAFYAPGPDYIGISRPDLFKDDCAHAATLAHELTHWTRHKSRLDRSNDAPHSCKKRYAFEELVAELGAAMIGAQFGIIADHIENHSAYLANWLDALKAEPATLFKAAALAQKAVDYIAEDIAAGLAKIAAE